MHCVCVLLPPLFLASFFSLSLLVVVDVDVDACIIIIKPNVVVVVVAMHPPSLSSRWLPEREERTPLTSLMNIFFRSIVCLFVWLCEGAHTHIKSCLTILTCRPKKKSEKQWHVAAVHTLVRWLRRSVGQADERADGRTGWERGGDTIDFWLLLLNSLPPEAGAYFLCKLCSSEACKQQHQQQQLSFSAMKIVFRRQK